MPASDWSFTKNPLTSVRNHTKKSGKKRKTVARLLMGEWIKLVDTVDGETKVKYRGGKGFVESRDFTTKRMLEVYFLDVGQGDCILIQTPDDRRILIDGGRDKKAHSFLKWKYNLKKESNNVTFDAIVMTHADADHAMGLAPILNDPQIIVKKFYHNGIARFKGGKIGTIKKKQLLDIYDDITTIPKVKVSRDYKKLIKSLEKARVHNPELIIEHLDNDSKKLHEFDQDNLTIKVLGPLNVGSINKPKFRYLQGVSETLNGNSVSLKLEYGKTKILLCGDMNEPFEDKFLDFHTKPMLKSHVFKANHHGSQDFGAEFLNTVKPWVSVVSSGDAPDYGHPRAVLLGSLGKYAPKNIAKPLVFATEVAATFKEISAADLKNMSTTKMLYEKTIQGVIHIRTDGKILVAGRVYGNSSLANSENPNGYQWDYAQFKL